MLDFKYIFSGLAMIFQPGLKRYVFIPLILSSLILAGFLWIAYFQFDIFMNWLLPADSWLHWLSWLLWPLFAITFLLIVFYGFTIIANLVAAPFNSRLAEAVAAKLDENYNTLNESSLMRDIGKSISAEVRKLMYYLVRAIPLLILMLFPLTSPVASVLWLLLTIWFLALEYLAYPMENQLLRFDEQKKQLRKKPLSSLSFGGGVMLLMFIPFINLAAMPAAVAGATIYWHQKIKEPLK